MSLRAAPLVAALVLLAGCGGSRAQRGPADVRGDAIRPVDRTPPEGTLSGATPSEPERFTLRRSDPVLQRDTVVRVDPPRRSVRTPDTTSTAPVRATTTSPPPAVSTPPPASSPAGSPAPGAGTSTPSAASGDYLVKPVPPEPITRVAPVYPERARQARVGGVVLVRALVDTEGRVRATRIARSIPELDSAAVQCVRQWRFKPGTSGGVAIATWADVPVRFLLP